MDPAPDPQHLVIIRSPQDLLDWIVVGGVELPPLEVRGEDPEAGEAALALLLQPLQALAQRGRPTKQLPITKGRSQETDSEKFNLNFWHEC